MHRGRLRFEPGHRLSDTAVDAGAEGHMSCGAPLDVKSVGLVPAPRVAVGGGKKQQHLFALAHSHPANFKRSCGSSAECLYRGLEAQHLLERAARQIRVLTESLPLIGIAGEAV